MVAVTDPLDSLAKSPERKILEAWFKILDEDSLISTAFHPRLIIENPTREAFASFGVWSMCVTPMRLRATDRPSERTELLVASMASFYVPGEQTEENSKLRGIDLGHYIRKLTWSNAGLRETPSTPFITFRSAVFEVMTPLVREDGVRILSYQSTYETDINPRTGDWE